jgi:protein involved in temperature-dependent protein secretion
VGKTEILFVRPSLMNGAARAIDLFADLDDYNVSNSPQEADARAIYADWLAISNDFEVALKKLNLTNTVNDQTK